MASTLISPADQQLIVAEIEEAEKLTSGEIRVHIEKTCPGLPLDRAAWLFKKLKMHKTELRNGVLIYLSVTDRHFAIIGDAGINQKVPAGFWDCVKDTALQHFAAGQIAQGLCQAVAIAGRNLKQFFPYNAQTDKNELPNEISF